jgi:hypothetical protein
MSEITSVQLAFSDVQFVSIEDLATKIKPLTESPTYGNRYTRRLIDQAKAFEKLTALEYDGNRFQVLEPFICIEEDGQLYSVNGNTRRESLLIARNLKKYSSYTFDLVPYKVLHAALLNVDAVIRIQEDYNDNTDAHGVLDVAAQLCRRWDEVEAIEFEKLKAENPDKNNDGLHKTAGGKATEFIKKTYSITAQRLSQLRATLGISETLVEKWLNSDRVSPDHFRKVFKVADDYCVEFHTEVTDALVDQTVDQWFDWMGSWSKVDRIKPAIWDKILSPLVTFSSESKIPLVTLVSKLRVIYVNLEKEFPTESDVKTLINGTRVVNIEAPQPGETESQGEPDTAFEGEGTEPSESPLKGSKAPSIPVAPAEFNRDEALKRLKDNAYALTVFNPFEDHTASKLADKGDAKFLALSGMANLLKHIAQKALIPNSQAELLDDLLEQVNSAVAQILSNDEVLASLDRDELHAFYQTTQSSLRAFNVLLGMTLQETESEASEDDLEGDEGDSVVEPTEEALRAEDEVSLLTPFEGVDYSPSGDYTAEVQYSA